MDTEFISCCICHNESKLVKVVYAEGHSLSLSKCKTCGLIFFSKRLSHKYIQSLYKDDKFNQSDANTAYASDDTQDFAERIKLTIPYLPVKIQLLDIGCSTGNFMTTARTILRPEILNGIDLNEITNKQCREICLDVTNKFPKQKYNFINMSDVIEHLPNPNSYMKRVSDITKKDGILMLTTPNIKNPINWIVNIKPLEHLWYFDKKTITKLLNKNRFAVINIQKWNRYHPLKHLINTSSANKIRPLIKFIIFCNVDWLFDWLILRHLYSDIFIIAKKVEK